MTDKMPREEIIRRLRVLAACRTGNPPPIEENHWLGDNMWVIGIGELAAAAADLLEAPGPKTRKEALESLPNFRWYAEEIRGDGHKGWLLDSLEALGVLKWRR